MTEEIENQLATETLTIGELCLQSNCKEVSELCELAKDLFKDKNVLEHLNINKTKKILGSMVG